MAAYLARTGYAVDVFERRPDPRREQIEAGRSINLAISRRGIDALEGIGLAERVLKLAIPMRGRMIHSPEGKLSYQPYGKSDRDCIRSVSRAGLNVTLLDAATCNPDIRVHFHSKVVGVDLDEPRLEVIDGSSGQGAAFETDALIGADGAFSAVRAPMQKLDRFDYRQDYLRHGYKELTIPSGPNGQHVMERNALHIWPRRSFMMIALPNLDGSFTCTLFWPFEGPNSFAALKTEADVLSYFQRVFPDVVPLMPSLAEEYFGNPTGSMVTVRCGPWYYRDKVVLLGDACHAVVPFYGQGMNAAFEDCVVLDECLRRHAPRWEEAFREYYVRRKVHTDTLADLAIGNFLEMRDRVGSRAFRLRKKLEIGLSKTFPNWYLPLYTMVSFTRTPYADAVRRARKQDRVVLAAALGLAVLLAIVLAYGVWYLVGR